MAAKKGKNGGDFILESRHLVGLFMLLVVIFGIVFTLGYLLGRGQYDARLRAVVGTPAGLDVQAAAPAAKSKAKPDKPEKPEPEDAQLPKKDSDWDFYHSAEAPKAEAHLQPPPKAVASAPQTPAVPKPAGSPKPAKPAKSAAAPTGADGLIPNGKIMLQVAAVLHQDDALALAQALQQKKFPAVVITPSGDKLYRVQVGPYSDNQSASNARQLLEAQGFKSIVKR